jgi:catechol 2,3-dioxygenase-like lactoylglutathione lyase family enzyme
MPEFRGVHHVKIPVTDLGTSTEWYRKVFGLDVAVRFEDSDGVVRGVMLGTPGEVFGLALRESPDHARGIADWDPVAYLAEDEAEVEAWAAHLDGLGIAHSPVIRTHIGALLVFRDPDGIEVRFYSGVQPADEFGATIRPGRPPPPG